MQLTTGQTVFISFAAVSGFVGKPVAWVTKGIVIDGENRIVRRESGSVSVFDSDYKVESLHGTSAEAWAAAADVLDAEAEAIVNKAAECRAKAAAAARIVAVSA